MDNVSAIVEDTRNRNRLNWTSRGPLVTVSLLAGLVITILWSANLVGNDIGMNAAKGILGGNSLTAGITDDTAGIIFAFTAGLSCTFTGCSVAAFSAVAPLMADASTAATRMRLALRPLGWLAAGLIVVAGVYGAIGATLGKSIPQFSDAMVGGIPEQTIQGMVVFSVIGLIFIYLGLAAVGVVPDPLRWPTARFSHTPQVVMGALIGGFLIGRPDPLFFKMFKYAVSTHNGFYGALSFVLVAIGSVLIMAVLFLALAASRFQQWLAMDPARTAKFTAAALLVGGAFTFFTWGIKLPASFGYGWFPTVPWQ